jgi:tetratricopeptide (TPR) repeat protein
MRQSTPAIAALLGLLLAGCVAQPRGRDLAAEYYNIGNAFLELGRYEKALDAFQDALRLDPGMVKADYNLALTHARMKKLPEAEAILRRLLASDPANAALLSTLAWAYHLGGKDDEALAQYDAVLTLAPETADAWYNSALILWKGGRNEEALRHFRRLLELAPEDPQGLLGAGSLLLAAGELAGARDHLERYLAKKPDDAGARYALADCLEQQRSFSRALGEYDRIIAKDPAQAGAWFGRARLLLTVVQDPDPGLESLRRALALGFSDSAAARALLDSDGLLERESVEAALREKGLPAEQAAPAASSAPAAAPATAPVAAPPAAP